MSHDNRQAEMMREAWRALRRFHWRFTVPAFVVTALMLGACLFLPRKYKAEATFERRTDLVLAEIMSRGGLRFQDPRQSTTEEIIGGPAIDQLIEQMGARIYPEGTTNPQRLDPTTLRRQLATKATIHYDIATADLDRIRIGFLAQDPVLAREAVNALVQNYLERTRKRIDERLEQSVTFYRTEASRARSLIEELENKKLAFEIENRTLLPDTSTGGLTPAADLKTRLEDLRHDLQSTQLRVEGLKKTLAETPDTSPSYTRARNPDMAAVELRLREQREKYANMVGSLKMTEKHPDVIALSEQIVESEKQLAALPAEVVIETQVAINPRRAELALLITNNQADIEAMTRQIESVERQIAARDSQNAQLFPVRSEYLKISREVDEARRQLAFWEDNQRRVEISMAAESGNRGVQLTFIQPAGPVGNPVSPNLYQALAGSIGLGLLAGTLGALLAYKNDDTFNDGQQLSSTYNVPMLGSVSEIISLQHRRMRQFKRRVLLPLNFACMAILLGLLAGVLYLDLQKPQVLEQWRGDPLMSALRLLGPAKATAAATADARPTTTDAQPISADAAPITPDTSDVPDTMTLAVDDTLADTTQDDQD